MRRDPAAISITILLTAYGALELGALFSILTGR